MNLYFEGSQIIVREDNKEVKLEYYLVEESDNNWENTTYGIKVIQTLEASSYSNYTGPISYDKVEVVDMVHTLMNHTVTVTTLLEIVDDLVSR